MAWRIVQQPNKLLAIFSDIVDDFTWYDMTEEEAVQVCIDEYDMGPKSAREKVQRGVDAGMARWNDEIETIRSIHGDTRADECIKDMSGAVS